MNLFKFYTEGGPFMNLILLMVILMLVVIIWKIIQFVVKKEFNFKLIDLILLSGSVSLAVGLLSQIIGVIEALDAIGAAGDISPQLVMQGAIVNFYAPIWGFIAFIISMVAYFVLKEIVKAKQG
jgi:hypothetical protein